MIKLVDTACFQPTVLPGDSDYEQEDALLAAMADDAHNYLMDYWPTPPITELILAFGVGNIIALFLARLSRPLTGEMEGETELWVVVGDAPSICFETTDAPTPALALELYCCIAQDWADNILAGRSLSDSFPITAEPTIEHANMLKSRIEMYRNHYIPVAGSSDGTPV